MAEAVLFNLAADILKLAGSITSLKIQLVCGARDELQSLKDTVETIQAVLLDAEKQRWHQHQVKHWLKRLKDVMYDVHDLLDDVATEDLRQKVTSGSKMLKEECIFFSKSNQLRHRFKVANKIQELRKKLDRIKNDKDFHLELHLSEATVAIARRRTTHSFVCKEEIIGREEDKREIIEHLFDSSSRESVSIVSIVGIGGLGKTALAQLVYNDDKVKDYFELKMWVCVSDVFDEDLIIKEILKSAQDECQEDLEIRNLQDIENKSKDQLQRLLRMVLRGKRYLLVLDDLWNEDRQRWLELQCLLMGGSWGSKILLTTRNQYKSWDLFKKMAFGVGEESLDPRLEEIGRDIVKKCAGVPLAIRTIGSLLSNKRENEWLYFKKHELSKIDKLDHGIMAVLKLSYDHLPLQLKHCFAYCFIESLDGNEDLEETGDSYVSDLLCRSFLEVEEVDYHTSEVKMFKMHDLMHDLALKVAGDECKVVNLNEGDISGGIRHASFASQLSSLQEVTSLLKVTNLRTFLSLKKRRTFVKNLSPNQYHGIFSKFRHCRTLVLGYSDFCIRHSFGSWLKYLRFLDISGNQSVKILPDSITDMLNLQTLKLSSCKKLTSLPRDLRKLINLRHLLIDGCDSLSHMPCGLNYLSSPRTLSQFIVQKIDHRVRSGVGMIDELGGLNRLVGSIILRKLEFLRPAPNKGHLREKQCLRSLKLDWSWAKQGDRSDSDELIMWENLMPHPNLAHLTISYYMGRSPPSWLSSTWNLVELELYLNLVGLVALEFVQEIGDSGHFDTARPFFPSLERLYLINCCNLKGWWGRRQLVGEYQDHRRYDLQVSFPKLSSLQISRCPHLSSVPLFPSIENLSLSGVCSKFLEQQVMAIPNCPLEATRVSTFVPLSKLKNLKLLGGVDLGHSMLETLLPFLSNLECMRLFDCIELMSLSRGMQYMSSLQRLTICACEKLDLLSHDDDHGTQWRSLSKLHALRITQLPKLVALPEGIQHITTLQFLRVECCENLTSFPEWIGNFSSLQRLQIIDCPGLMYLPDGMRHLTSLKELKIVRCPILAERCQTESSADWKKIAHVACLSFELELI
ncbi:hypothetical protein BT93_H1380 [Corymbia citriodora subsp. variegata]|nr:hypothetical protein BT93_H1380 [Corymbia citriodora subsp. variegata]